MNRNVFAYTDWTGQQRFADPLAVWRRFVEALEGDPNSVLEAAAVRPPEGQPEGAGDLLLRLEAERKLAEATRVAFDLAGFDSATGEGATETELLDLLWRFLEDLEKNARPAAKPAI